MLVSQDYIIDNVVISEYGGSCDHEPVLSDTNTRI